MGVDDARIPRGAEVQGSQFEAYALLRAKLVSGSWYVSSRRPRAVCFLYLYPYVNVKTSSATGRKR